MTSFHLTEFGRYLTACHRTRNPKTMSKWLSTMSLLHEDHSDLVICELILNYELWTFVDYIFTDCFFFYGSHTFDFLLSVFLAYYLGLFIFSLALISSIFLLFFVFFFGCIDWLGVLPSFIFTVHYPVQTGVLVPPRTNLCLIPFSSV